MIHSAICAALALGTLASGGDGSAEIALTRKSLNDGTEMPILGLGTWKSPKGEVEAAVRHALCIAGYRHIDAAQIYQNQQEVGSGIRYALAKCGLSREDLWVTSKLWMADFHPEHVPSAVDRILHELGLNYVDQLLLHWPVAFKRPPAGCPPECPQEFAGTDDPQRPRDADGKLVTSNLPIVDTWKALQLVKAAGKVRSIGVSNFNATEIDVLLKAGELEAPAVNQVEAHVFWSQRELREAMKKWNIALVAYSPLANPAMYSDKMQGMSSALIQEVASANGLTSAQVMLSFLVTLGDIVVPKSVTPARIESNAHFPMKLPDAAMVRLLAEAPQNRMANPKLRDGHLPVFQDVFSNKEKPEL